MKALFASLFIAVAVMSLPQFVAAQTSGQTEVDEGSRLPAPSRLVRAAMVGPRYRFRLLFSKPFADAFESSAQQKELESKVLERISLDKPEINQLVREVDDQTTEAEAERIFADVRKRYSDEISLAEDELANIVGPEHYERLILTHLGLVGPTGLLDHRIADAIGLEGESLQDVRKLIKDFVNEIRGQKEILKESDAEDFKARFDSQLRSKLNLEQREMMERAEKHAIEFMSHDTRDLHEMQIPSFSSTPELP
ncbi:hypothetical protein [Rhodopirellula europaea]|uniref:Secreted protein n=1 Tax=Rhodopirellula europaea 6C TaxID=1263867 RepID=M2APK2_9BACT|nr:hypothetical protein [Rhodopirellula europaea]EMB19000.1 secreted protein [Rhodopirellula europaea 6C]